MNFLDIVPVDILPSLAHSAGINRLKVVPTNDLNMTFALSLGVFFLIIFYSIKIKGIRTFIKELTLQPFNTKWLIPFVTFVDDPVMTFASKCEDEDVIWRNIHGEFVPTEYLVECE